MGGLANTYTVATVGPVDGGTPIGGEAQPASSAPQFLLRRRPACFEHTGRGIEDATGYGIDVHTGREIDIPLVVGATAATIVGSLTIVDICVAVQGNDDTES